MYCPIVCAYQHAHVHAQWSGPERHGFVRGELLS